MKVCVMSGGGSNGAVQVGILRKLLDDDIRFDGFAGTSTGSLNALCLAQAPDKAWQPGYLSVLESLYRDKNLGKQILGNDSIFTKGLRILRKQSLYSHEHLQRLIGEIVADDKVFRSPFPLQFGVTNLSTGQYMTLDKTTPLVQRYGFAACVTASCIMPGYMEPIKIGPWSLVDGGLANITPLKEGFNILKELGADLEDSHEIHVLLASSPVPPLVTESSWPLNKLLGRTLNIILKSAMQDDIEYAIFKNSNANALKTKIFVYEPGINFGEALNFDKPFEMMMEYGKTIKPKVYE